MTTTLLEELQARLHDHIPLSQAMQAAAVSVLEHARWGRLVGELVALGRAVQAPGIFHGRRGSAANVTPLPLRFARAD